MLVYFQPLYKMTVFSWFLSSSSYNFDELQLASYSLTESWFFELEFHMIIENKSKQLLFWNISGYCLWRNKSWIAAFSVLAISKKQINM